MTEKMATTSLDDLSLILSIAQRASKIYADHETSPLHPVKLIEAELRVVHATTPLRLADMLAGRDFDLIHDVGGIHKHLDWATGDLMECFLPRYACPVRASA